MSSARDAATSERRKQGVGGEMPYRNGWTGLECLEQSSPGVLVCAVRFGVEEVSEFHADVLQSVILVVFLVFETIRIYVQAGSFQTRTLEVQVRIAGGRQRTCRTMATTGHVCDTRLVAPSIDHDATMIESEKCACLQSAARGTFVPPNSRASSLERDVCSR